MSSYFRKFDNENITSTLLRDTISTMSTKMNKELSLSEKLSSLIHTLPTLIDPEDEEDLTTREQIAVDDGNSDYSADELQCAQFRKLNIELLDAEDSKYSGKKSSRVEVTNAFSSGSSDVEESSDNDNKHDESIDDSVSDVSSGVDENSSSVEKSDADASDTAIPGLEDKKGDSFHQKIFLKAGSDIEKGKAIKNQLCMWDLLLECRIKFQKCLLASNQLPKFDQFKKFEEYGRAEFKNLITQNQSTLKKLLNSLLLLQDETLTSNEEFSNNSSKHQISDVDGDKQNEEITSDSDSDSGVKKKETLVPYKKKQIKLTDFSVEIGERHKVFEEFRNKTIQKWNDKTRIQTASNKNFNAFEQSTLKQIEHVLLDKPKLIKRTQVKRSNYHILGQNDDEYSSPVKVLKTDDNENNLLNKNKQADIYKEIFDDDDFYHQLLSELLKRKASDVTDPVQLGRQWIQLQKVRSKMKRKVDVKASKGRKVRFVVHPKLVNFMMPIDNFASSEESRTELFNSIFGKNQKQV